MAGKSTAFANELLKLIFNGTSIANIADNAASSPITNWEVVIAEPAGGMITINSVSMVEHIATQGTQPPAYPAP